MTAADQSNTAYPALNDQFSTWFKQHSIPATTEGYRMTTSLLKPSEPPIAIRTEKRELPASGKELHRLMQENKLRANQLPKDAQLFFVKKFQEAIKEIQSERLLAERTIMREAGVTRERIDREKTRKLAQFLEMPADTPRSEVYAAIERLIRSTLDLPLDLSAPELREFAVQRRFLEKIDVQPGSTRYEQLTSMRQMLSLKRQEQ